jgi:anaerobic dimethyl sulfoxide reductase subunit B (iron-sulfur subunit)
VACKDKHDVPAGPASWLRLKTIEKGEYPDPFVGFLTIHCYHCGTPACVSTCPVGAISKREKDGIVVVARDLCVGKDKCGMCLEVCSYTAPQFGAEADAKMQMCNLCVDRLEDRKNPICVDACPARALDAGPIEKLQAKYGDIGDAEGFVYSDQLIPSIVFTPKKDRKGRAVKKVVISPQIMLSR